MLAELSHSSRARKSVGAYLNLVRDLPHYQNFTTLLEQFYHVGEACLSVHNDWFRVLADKSGTIHACFDQKDPSTIHYVLRINVRGKLTNVFAVGNEVQHMTKWNQMVSKEPEILGKRSALHFILNYCISAGGGLFKLEILNEVQRFVDTESGLLAERIRAVPEGHPHHRTPSPGHRTAEIEIDNLWIACGEMDSVFIQAGKVRSPFPISKFLATKIGSVSGRVAMHGFVKNATKAAEEGSLWEPSIREDSLGLYRQLDQCVQSRASMNRSPAKGRSVSSVGADDILPFFKRVVLP
jgi:hypothetical protein